MQVSVLIQCRFHTQISRLGGKHLYLLSDLGGPKPSLLYLLIYFGIPVNVHGGLQDGRIL